jgi:endothelin-converting enzyme/putative endopeptidase
LASSAHSQTLSFKQTASIIEDAAKANPAPGSNERKIADLYHSYMDEAAIESHGLSALKPHLDAIAAVHTPRELAHALGLSLRADVDSLNGTNFRTANIFGLWVAPSFNDPDHYALRHPTHRQALSRPQGPRKTLVA